MLKFLFKSMGATTALGLQLALWLVAVQVHFKMPGIPVFWFVALVSAVLMFATYRIKNFMEAIPTSKVRSVAMGMAELSGKASGKTIKGPFSGRDCLAYEINEMHRQRINRQYIWVTTRKERKDGLFYLDDGTGKLLCDSKGANLEVKPFERFFGTIKRTELAILPEKKYYVIGKIVDNPFVKDATSVEGWKDLMMSDGDVYIISDRGEKGLRKWYGMAFLVSAVSTASFIVAALIL